MVQIESILDLIKKLLGVADDDNSFDADIITHINTNLMLLCQIGVGDKPFFITGSDEKWSDFLGEDELLESVKSYIYLKVKKIFDPPTNATVAQSMKESIDELEWHISDAAERRKQATS